MDLSFFLDGIVGFFRSSVTWIVVIFLVLFSVVGVMKIRQKRKMSFKVLIINELGNDKIAIDERKAGFFKKVRKFKGLLEQSGEDEFVTNKQETIYGYNSTDQHEFGKGKVVIVTPNPDNPKQLFVVPTIRISKKTREAFMKIAPLEIQEAAVDGFNKSTQEMKSTKDKIWEIATFALLVIGIFLVVLVISQWQKNNIDKITAMNSEALSTQRDIAGILSRVAGCGGSSSTTPSTAP
jgi:hypothetical protein